MDVGRIGKTSPPRPGDSALTIRPAWAKIRRLPNMYPGQCWSVLFQSLPRSLSRRRGVLKDPSERKRLLLLSFISLRNPYSVTVTQGRLTFFKTASVLAPLALAGSLLLTPIVSHARISPAQLASHNARLAKIQAQQRVRLAAHNAQLVKAQAKHQAQIAAHEAKMLVRQHNAQAHLAKIQAKSSPAATWSRRPMPSAAPGM
jgi:hypothetical protein